MTIDVGYAWLDLEDGSSIDFVDVPGHDALIGNMLVGAGEIDAALLVVAYARAGEGDKAQALYKAERGGAKDRDYRTKLASAVIAAVEALPDALLAPPPAAGAVCIGRNL